MSEPRDYTAMTVNERLFVSGKMDGFDAAIEQRDESALRGILSGLDLGQENIDSIIADLLREV